ncbi:hypothetical protein SGLAM104S_08458 [Streptomyces glaucescens]
MPWVVDLAVDFLVEDVVVFLAVVFFAGVVEVDFLPPVCFGAGREVRGVTSAPSPRDSLAARTLFSRAAMRSRTLPLLAGSGVSGGLAGGLGGDDLLDGLAVLVVEVGEVDLAEGVHEGVGEVEFLVADGDAGCRGRRPRGRGPRQATGGRA